MKYHTCMKDLCISSKNLCCSSMCLFIAMHLSEDEWPKHVGVYRVHTILSHIYVLWFFLCIFTCSIFFLHGTETGTYSLVQAYILSTLFSSFIIGVLFLKKRVSYYANTT